ncbi:MAG: nucleotide exchange factor GrpE [Myxococcales bacterium]|nr:nucleotide exchange factor GrpE [Myxococcales bacterium]
MDEKAALRHALADLEAAQTRVARDAERVERETRASLVADFLPVLDNLDRTLLAATQSAESTLTEGVRMVRDQFEQVLFRYGVERVPAVGQAFDPAHHEAIAMEDVEPARKGRVIRQITAGYLFGGKVLRPAKVIVGRSVPTARNPNDWQATLGENVGPLAPRPFPPRPPRPGQG